MWCNARPRAPIFHCHVVSHVRKVRNRDRTTEGPSVFFLGPYLRRSLQSDFVSCLTTSGSCVEADDHI